MESVVVPGVRSVGLAVQMLLDYGGPLDETHQVIGKAVLAGSAEYHTFAVAHGYRRKDNWLQRRTEAVFLEDRFRYAASQLPERGLGDIGKELCARACLERLLTNRNSHRSLVLDPMLGTLTRCAPDYDAGLSLFGELVVAYLQRNGPLSAAAVNPMNIDLARLDKKEVARAGGGANTYLDRLFLLSKEFSEIRSAAGAFDEGVR